MFPLLKINQFLSYRQKKAWYFLILREIPCSLKNIIGNTKRNTTPLNGIEVRQTGPAMAVFGVYEKLHDGNQ